MNKSRLVITAPDMPQDQLEQVQRELDSGNDDYIWIFDKWEEIGKVWVDSGQIMIVDPCKVLEGKEYDDNIVHSKPINFKGGIINAGWGGDGNYPIYVKKDSRGLVTEMKIVFTREVDV